MSLHSKCSFKNVQLRDIKRILNECFCFIEFIERVNMRGLPTILSLFSNEFDKFTNTVARKFDSIYHMTLKLLL